MSDRPDAPYGWALFGDQLERIRPAALRPGETSRRRRRTLAAGPVRRRRRRGASGSVRPDRPDQSDRIWPLQGQCRPNLPEHLPVPAPDGDRSAAVRGPRSAPGDPLVPSADLRGSAASPTGVRAVLLEDLPAAARFRAPLAFVSGLLNDPRAEAAYQRLANPTLLVFGDHPRFTDPAAAEALIAANVNLERITIDHAGDLPQMEQPEGGAAPPSFWDECATQCDRGIRQGARRRLGERAANSTARQRRPDPSARNRPACAMRMQQPGPQQPPDARRSAQRFRRLIPDRVVRSQRPTGGAARHGRI